MDLLESCSLDELRKEVMGFHLLLIHGVDDVSGRFGPCKIAHVHPSLPFHAWHVRMRHFHLERHDAVTSSALVVELLSSVGAQQ